MYNLDVCLKFTSFVWFKIFKIFGIWNRRFWFFSPRNNIIQHIIVKSLDFIFFILSWYYFLYSHINPVVLRKVFSAVYILQVGNKNADVPRAQQAAGRPSVWRHKEREEAVANFAGVHTVLRLGEAAHPLHQLPHTEVSWTF